MDDNEWKDYLAKFKDVVNMGNNLNYGVVGIVALLMGFGGSVVLTKDQLDHGYVCTTTESVGFFNNLSSTMKTGYFDKGSSVCRNGVWIPLKQYAKDKGVSIDTLLNNKPEDAVSYLCDQFKCEAVD